MDQYDFYPPKPELIENKAKSNLAVTIFSIVIFALTFLLLFGDEINFIIYLIVVLLVHEMGHYAMMKLFKYENVRMLFVPLMGAFVQGNKSNYSQKQSFIVTAAGPFPGVLIGALMMWYGNVMHSYWMVELSSLFLLLNLINLLPLDPLDGGQLFKLFVSRKFEMFLMIFALVSSLFIIGLGWILDSYIIILFGFFMGFRVRALQKQYLMHRDLTQVEVNYSTSYKLLSNRDFMKIKEVLIEHTPPLRKFLDDVPSDESDPIMASQVNNVLNTPIERDASLGFKLMILLVWLCSFAVPVLLYFTLDYTWLRSVLTFTS